MSVTAAFAWATVLLAGLYFVVLAAAALLAPSQAGRFLMGFATTAPRHYAELVTRLLVGAAFVLKAPHLRFPDLFSGFGWLLVLTTAGLMLVPWRWHQRFAARAVARALRFLPLIGLASLGWGAIVLTAIFWP